MQLDISVVVPVRDAAAVLPACLRSIRDQNPCEVVVVDGGSRDGSLELAKDVADTVLDDGGRGLPVARAMGIRAARGAYVALVDSDVVLPPGALGALVHELERDGYLALQAGLHSVGGPGYWGRGLATQHRRGRSRWWFGLVATVARRDDLLELEVDPRFRSGEDVELRIRLQRAGARVGVSEQTTVLHRFSGDDFAFARGQWLDDGAGLLRTVRKHPSAWWLLGAPVGGALRGVSMSVLRGEPEWLPYYPLYATYNYLGMLRSVRRDRWSDQPSTIAVGAA